MSERTAGPGGNQYATFVVGGHYLAIGVQDVQEVLRAQRLTIVPLAPPVVAGLINLRGQIVPAIGMRRLLRLPAGEDSAAAFSVVVRAGGNAVSFQVDEIGDVLELDASSFDPPPQNVDAPLRKLLAGVHKLKDRLLLVLDTGRTLDAITAKSFEGTE